MSLSAHTKESPSMNTLAHYDDDDKEAFKTLWHLIYDDFKELELFYYWI